MLPKSYQKNPHLFAFCWTDQNQYTNDNKGKAKILAKRFFLKVGQADLQNINNQTYPLLLNISYIISVKEIKNAIQKLLIGKMLRPNKIPNKAIKVVLKELVILFANAATACL